MTIYLRPKLESLSTEELLSLQADAFSQLTTLADSDPRRVSGEGILDIIIDVLANRLDNQAVLGELDRMYAL